MKREYIKTHSWLLDREMEMLVFGHGGLPILVFPTSMGKFYEYEDRSMIGVLQEKYERGDIQAFCVDSIDSESWYNKGVHPRQRVLRHNQYEQYLIREVLPFIRSRNSSPSLLVTGCSFGGYHAMNFSLKYPDLLTHCVSMGAMYDIRSYVNGYYDEDCYFNCPLDFLPNLTDEKYLNQYRTRVRFVLATGENDICLESNRQLSRIMEAKSIPHLLDVWGDGTGHDWPWWQQMAVKFFS